MRSDIYALKDSKLPAGMIMVTEIRDGEVKFCSYGGGWHRKMPAEKLDTLYRKVDLDEIKQIEWWPAEFDIDGAYEDKLAEGYSNGLRWNGFAQPAFAKEGLERIREIFNAGDSEIRLDEERDVVIVDLGPEVDDDCRFEEYPGFDIVVQGGKIKRVYGVGAGSWVWDEVVEDEDTDS